MQAHACLIEGNIKMATVFDPIEIGDYKLKNRIFMVPLTRGRSGTGGVPNDMMAEYYAQRADAGLWLAVYFQT